MSTEEPAEEPADEPAEAVAAWDREAADFDTPADHGLRDPTTRAAWRALLLEHLPPAPARIADLGSGTGTLSLLLAAEGHEVDAVDFSPAMVDRARAKAAAVADLEGQVTFTLADAADPPLPDATYDAVLCRHVLWALPDPLAALRRWHQLLTPTGTLLLVEGHWGTGAGLTGQQTLDLVQRAGRPTVLHPLADPALWGRPIDDERYLVVSPPLTGETPGTRRHAPL